MTTLRNALQAEDRFKRQTLLDYVMEAQAESGREWGRLTVCKYDEDAVNWVSRRKGGTDAGTPGFLDPTVQDWDEFGIAPFEELISACNIITRAGWTRVFNLGFNIQSTGQYGSANCRIGVGTGTTSATTADADLVGATSAGRLFNLVTGNGTTAAGTATFRMSVTSTFASGDANFAWQEWVIDNGTTTQSSGAAGTPVFNRSVSSQGTKASPQVWTATANLDFA